MSIVIDVLQAAMLILGAPLVRGIIARLKAHLQRRRGASIWRPYVELFKLLRKEDVICRNNLHVGICSCCTCFGPAWVTW